MRKPSNPKSYGWLRIATECLPPEFASKVLADEECWESPEGLIVAFRRGDARIEPVSGHASATIPVGAKYLCHDLRFEMASLNR